MTIEINGMAHVILTVSRFDIARDFYRKLLPQFGMKPVSAGGGTVKVKNEIGVDYRIVARAGR